MESERGKVSEEKDDGECAGAGGQRDSGKRRRVSGVVGVQNGAGETRQIQIHHMGIARSE